MISVCKQFHFCYAHHLPEYKGVCSRVHGHNALVEVEVGVNTLLRQELDSQGMVVDFSELKSVVELVLKDLDHRNLNEVFDDGVVPTAENIVLWIKERLDLWFLERGLQLLRLRVSETPSCWAEWKKE